MLKQECKVVQDPEYGHSESFRGPGGFERRKRKWMDREPDSINGSRRLGSDHRGAPHVITCSECDFLCLVIYLKIMSVQNHLLFV